MTRGLVVPLTLAQIATRARYLAGEVQGPELDAFVRGPAVECPAIYYRLNGDDDGLPPYNGGTDPMAPDPADRWSKPGSTFVNITADCMAGAAWCGGFDRKQPVRFAHLYGGSINTNSMILDAQDQRRCFEPVERPAPGLFVVCASGSPGHKVGHIGTIVDVPAEWDAGLRECWEAVGVVDIASRGAGVRANKRTTARGWFGTGALFVQGIMQP
jgi:hypothetical protein